MFKTFRIVCCACLALGLASQFITEPAVGQVRVGVDGPIPLGKLDEMENLLQLADADQKADLLVRLGIDSAIADQAAHNPLPGQTIELKPVRAPGKTHYGFAFLPSGTGTSCYLYLLAGSADFAKEPWRVMDSRQLDWWFEPSSLIIAPLRRADADDLVLHHIMEGHGSGYAAYQMQVFSILDGKLVQTLATRDYLYEVTVGEEDSLEQTSTFLQFPGNLLEESRTSARNGNPKQVERRYWYWSEQDNKFLPSPFAPVAPPHAP